MDIPPDRRTEEGDTVGMMQNVEHTGDMVAVVRCRDCKYGYPETNGNGEDMVMCTNAGNPIGFENWFMPSDWYCADGERR